MTFKLVRDNTAQGNTDGAIKAKFLEGSLQHMPYSNSWGGDFTARHQNGWLSVEEEPSPPRAQRGDYIYLVTGNHAGWSAPYTDWSGEETVTSQSAQNSSLLTPWRWTISRYTRKPPAGSDNSPSSRFEGYYIMSESSYDGATKATYTGDGGYMYIMAWDQASRNRIIDESQTHKHEPSDTKVIANFMLGVGGEYTQAVIEEPFKYHPGDIISGTHGARRSPWGPLYLPPPPKRELEIGHAIHSFYPRTWKSTPAEEYYVRVFDDRPTTNRGIGGQIQIPFREPWKNTNKPGWHNRLFVRPLYDPWTMTTPTTGITRHSRSLYKPLLIDGSATYPFPIWVVPIAMTDTMTHKLVARSIDPKTNKVVRESVVFRHNALSPNALCARRIGPTTLVVVVVLTSPYYRRGGPSMSDQNTDPNIPLDTVVATYISTDNGETWQRAKDDTMFEIHRHPPEGYVLKGSIPRFDPKLHMQMLYYERTVYFTSQISRIEVLPLREGLALMVASRSYIVEKQSGEYAGRAAMMFDIAVGLLDVKKKTLVRTEVLYTSPDHKAGQMIPPQSNGQAGFYEDERTILFYTPWTPENPAPWVSASKYWMDATQRIADVAVSPTGVVIMAGVDRAEPANVTLHYYDTNGIRQQTVPIPSQAYIAGSATGEHDGTFRFTIAGGKKMYHLSWNPKDGFQDERTEVDGITISAISEAVSSPPPPNRPTRVMFTVDRPPRLYYEVGSISSRVKTERCICSNGEWRPLSPSPAWVYK